LDDQEKARNPLTRMVRDTPLAQAQGQLTELRDHFLKTEAVAPPIPLLAKDHTLPGRDWLPEPKWISGWNAFEILRLQAEPHDYAEPIAKICEIIADQTDRESDGVNYAIASRPPSHELLQDFEAGSIRWFRALYALLKIRDAEEIDGWETLVSDLHDWITYTDDLRICARDVLVGALSLNWIYYDLSLPEAKQEPIWSFPKAMAWIATRDYVALARIGTFWRAANDDAVAENGVCKYNTQALGWLHTALSYAACGCGALEEFGMQAFKHCTCISVAWEELVRYRGGLLSDTPELVFGLQEGWLSMTWPDGADDVRFLRRDILDHWPARPVGCVEPASPDQSTTAGEQDCRKWLIQEFASDTDRRRSKKDFRDAALATFKGRLSERGFNHRVWPELARQYGRDGAGAKRKL